MELDLEKALAGQPVMLRNGMKAFIRHYETELEPSFPLQGYMRKKFNYCHAAWTKEGYAFIWSTEDHSSFRPSEIESDHDIVGMWVEPAVFNHWDALDPRWKFIAADEDGEVCVFIAEPSKRSVFWTNGGEEFIEYMKVTYLFNFEYTHWENSLVKRPMDS